MDQAPTNRRPGDRLAIPWSEVGTARIAGLPDTVQVGLFVTSPGAATLSEGASRFTSATAVLDHVEVAGATPGATWALDDVGAEPGLPDHLRGMAEESGGTLPSRPRSRGNVFQIGLMPRSGTS